MFERYTESARRALFIARYESSELGSLSIETEHLLLGLLRNAKGIVGSLLANARVSPEDLSRELKERSTFRERVSTSVEIPFSEETKRVLVFAAEEADRLGHGYVGTEHLLLALIREERSVAGSVLAAHGLRLDSVRDQLVAILNEAPALGANHDPPGAQSHLTPALRIQGMRSFLEHLGRTLPDDDDRALIDRICRDLDTLKQRLS